MVRLKFVRSIAILLASGLVGVTLAQLSPAERNGLRDALYVANLVEKDLQYEKKITTDPYRNPLDQLALDKPLQAADDLLKLHGQATGNLSSILSAADRATYGDPLGESADTPILGPLPDDVPEDLKEPVEVLVGAIDESTQAVHQAISKLSLSERREIIEGLPILCAASKLVKFGFTRQDFASLPRLLELLGKVDLPAIRSSARRLTQIVEQEIPELRNLSRTLHLDKSLRFLVHGYRVEIDSAAGIEHTSRDTNLLISFGDRNRFTGRFGSGIGYSSILLDFGDSSYYDVPDLSVGSGVLGIGLAFLYGNGDVLNGRSVCFGAGLAGVGAVYHEGRDPTYRALSLSEGFGAFGQGVLVETGDRARLDVQVYGQGSARTQGLGWLIARGSDDTFTSGGLISVDKTSSYLSGAQGFGSGFGLDDEMVGGGVGLVSTFGTNENYIGGVRCQAVGLSGGLGSIFDQGLRGSHLSTQESQGYANHQSAAFLFNLGGINSYTAKVGATQGFSSDFSLAMVLDRGSHDLWANRDSRPATALANGLALFLNSGDENGYVGEPSLAVPARGASSLGIFCDLGSNTRYTSEVGFSPIKVESNLSVFFQALNPTGAPIETGGSSQQFAPGSVPNPGDSKIGVLWEAARGIGSPAEDARKSLISIGVESLRFLLRNHPAWWSSGMRSAITEVVNGIGDPARSVLAVELASGEMDRRRDALRIACLSPGSGLDAGIISCLDDPKLQRVAVRAAGLCKVKGAVPGLERICRSADPVCSLSALIALDQIGDSGASAIASNLVSSGQWPERRVAVGVVAKNPALAMTVASTLLESSDEQLAREGVDLLVALGDPDSLRRLNEILNGSKTGLILQVLIDLNGRVPDEMKVSISKLQLSQNLTIKRVAESVRVD